MRKICRPHNLLRLYLRCRHATVYGQSRTGRILFNRQKLGRKQAVCRAVRTGGAVVHGPSRADCKTMHDESPAPNTGEDIGRYKTGSVKYARRHAVRPSTEKAVALKKYHGSTLIVNSAAQFECWGET